MTPVLDQRLRLTLALQGLYLLLLGLASLLLR